ncbi:MAG: DUF1638 domain-containing protein [Spirochaetaceae bacterium]|jgi:hypothetical protein|nr:DUF1638 domain-containing protein [Spirochaetaceae bacterium]
MTAYKDPNRGDVMIACRMLEDEIATAMKKTGSDIPVIWVERGLHEKPDRLRTALMEQIESQPQAGTILLAYSLCGNAMADLGSRTSRLVVPRFHDCIQMGLAIKPDQPIAMDIYSMYFTRGWLRGERSLAASYQRVCSRYGREKAHYIYKDNILKNYRSFTLLDNGAFPVDECLPEIRALAGQFDLECKVGAGSTRILEKLVSGDWDREFCIIPPGERFSQPQFFG